MKRTEQLMASVTASLLLVSAAPGTRVASSLQAQARADSAKSEAWKTDPAVASAASQIFDWLETKTGRGSAITR